MKQIIFDINALGDVSLTEFGQANTMLVNMVRQWPDSGGPRPQGFLIADLAYDEVVTYNFLEGEAEELLFMLAPIGAGTVAQLSLQIQDLLLRAALPFVFQVRVVAAYQKLTELSSSNGSVYMVCSPIFLKNGQYVQPPYIEVLGPIKGENEMLNGCKKCYATLFHPQNLKFQLDQEIPVFNAKLSIGVIEADHRRENPIKNALSILEEAYDDLLVV